MRTLIFLGIFLGALAGRAQRIAIDWPTPNPAFLEGKPIEAFIQPTVSGEPASGCFGCVRSNGYQFHEGLDLKPVSRDRHGEPADPVFAVLPGVVRYINNRPGESSYGRYLVLEHPGVTPAIYTLYAHLSAIAPGIRIGGEVGRGQTIAVMGRTAGGYGIPKERAHLHFEMGLMVTRDFQRWYDWKRFGSPNEHGIWNGFNLMGFDPLEFYTLFRDHKIDNVREYFARIPVAVTVRIATRRTPDFALRYPSLVHGAMPLILGGWEMDCNWTGLPIALRPLPAGAPGLGRPGGVTIVSWDQASARAHRCKSLVREHRGGVVPGKDLAEVLQQMFGVEM